MNHDSYGSKYMEHIREIFNRTKETQMTAINEAAKKVAEAIADGHAIYIFDASYAGILAQEMFYRTDGLAVVNLILPAEFILSTRPVDRTSAMERLEGYPTVILDHTAIQEGDVLILHSVSERDTVAIEMRIEAGKEEVYTTTITNTTYTSGVTSRRSGGRKPFEVYDMYINSCGDFEDSSMLFLGIEQKIVPTSSVIGCGIMDVMEICIVEHLLAMDVVPPVFHSADVDSGVEFNQVLFGKYEEQIHYMK